MKKGNPQQFDLMFPDMRYTFADFFAGAGGLSLGFINAGMKCVAALEYNDEAAWTYWYNLCYNTWSHLWIDPQDEKRINKVRKKWNNGETSNWLFKKGVPDNWLQVNEPMPCLNLFLMDITKLEPEYWMKLIGVRERDIKVFVGGPPCQGFSTSGRRDVLDKRNQLALRMIYYAKICKPRYVVIENVPGLLTLGKKKGDLESPFVTWIREAFEDAGYQMNFEVHNAADYGVPQNRKRVIFFAQRIDDILDDSFDLYKSIMTKVKPLEPGEIRLYTKSESKVSNKSFII